MVPGIDAMVQDRMIQRIALGMQRHEAVDPRRLNAPPGPIRILMPNDPFQTELDTGFAARFPRQRTVGVQIRLINGQHQTGWRHRPETVFYGSHHEDLSSANRSPA